MVRKARPKSKHSPWMIRSGVDSRFHCKCCYSPRFCLWSSLILLRVALWLELVCMANIRLTQNWKAVTIVLKIFCMYQRMICSFSSSIPTFLPAHLLTILCSFLILCYICNHNKTSVLFLIKTKIFLLSVLLRYSPC